MADDVLLNIQRACEAALDMGQHLIRREKLGIPQSSRDVFRLLCQGGWIDPELSDVLRRMVGFRNIAVLENIIRNHLEDFLRFSQTVLLKDS